MTPQQRENELRIKQRILISKNNVLRELIDRHTEELVQIRHEILQCQRERQQAEATAEGVRS